MRAEHSLTSTVGKGKGFFAREPNKQAKSSMYYLSLDSIDRPSVPSRHCLGWLAAQAQERPFVAIIRYHVTHVLAERGEHLAFLIPAFLPLGHLLPLSFHFKNSREVFLPSFPPSQRRLLPAAAYRPPFLLLIFDASSREGGRISSTMTSSSSSSWSSSVVATANQPRIRQCQVRDVVKRENSRIAAAASRDDRRDERSRSGRADHQCVNPRNILELRRRQLAAVTTEGKTATPPPPPPPSRSPALLFRAAAAVREIFSNFPSVTVLRRTRARART